MEDPDFDVTADRCFNMQAIINKQQIVIEALVQAVNVARRSMPLNIGASPHVRAAHSVVDAALALAREGGSSRS